jgi:hypothetical protein
LEDRKLLMGLRWSDGVERTERALGTRRDISGYRQRL